MRLRPLVVLLATASVAALFVPVGGGRTGALDSSVAARDSTGNLIVNGGAEDGPALDCTATRGINAPGPAGWTASNGFTALPNNCEAGGLPGSTGGRFFLGGDNHTLATATQIVPLASYAAAIDGGRTIATVKGMFGGWQTQRDTAWVEVTFLDQAGKPLPGSLKTDAPTTADRGNATKLLPRSDGGTVPRLARSARVVLEAQYFDGAVWNDGYVDDVSLTLQLGVAGTTTEPTKPKPPTRLFTFRWAAKGTAVAFGQLFDGSEILALGSLSGRGTVRMDGAGRMRKTAGRARFDVNVPEHDESDDVWILEVTGGRFHEDPAPTAVFTVKVTTLVRDCAPRGTLEIRDGKGKFKDKIVLRACGKSLSFTDLGAGEAGVATVAISEPK